MAVGERLTRFERVVVARPATVPPREGGGQLLDQRRRDHLVSPVHFSARIRAASWPLTTAFTVAGYHRLPPCAVGTPSALSAAAILPKLTPDVRLVTMRATTSAGNVDGRPSRTPAAFFAASAALVRWRIRSRSSSEIAASIRATRRPFEVVRSASMSAM